MLSGNRNTANPVQNRLIPDGAVNGPKRRAAPREAARASVVRSDPSPDTRRAGGWQDEEGASHPTPWRAVGQSPGRALARHVLFASRPSPETVSEPAKRA